MASSEQLEPDLGIYSTPHRRYTPTLGRWMTPDPGGVKAVDPADPQTWNMYAYARNNPTTLMDPSGEYFVVGAGDEKFFEQVLTTLYERPEGRSLVESLARSTKPVILGRDELGTARTGQVGVSTALAIVGVAGVQGVHTVIGTDTDLILATKAAPGQAGAAITTAHELEHALAGLTAGKGSLQAGAAAMAEGDRPSSPRANNTLGGSAQAGASAIMKQKRDLSSDAANAEVIKILKSGIQQWQISPSRVPLCQQNGLDSSSACK